jgi:predicted DNA-binding transcriptional regulator AlpA
MPPKVVYYTPEKVSRLAGCVVQTIYRHLEHDKFPNARRIGLRKWIIPEDDVIEYLGYNPNETEVLIIK